MNTNLTDKLSVAGKTVVVTGATGFFGAYIARGFLELGAKVILLSRSEQLGQQVSEYQKEFGPDATHAYQVDFYDLQALEKTLRKVVVEHQIDVLINNAYDLSAKTGFNTLDGRLENSPYRQWQFAFEAGIYWPVIATQIIGSQFQDRGKGSIINVSSMYGIVAPNPRLYEGKEFFNPPSYGVIKSGILALTRYTASFWAKDGVRCNAIVPGSFPNIETQTANKVEKNDPFIQRLENNTVLGRVGHPKDLIGPLVFLASDASSYMTGQPIVVDGGWTIL